MNRYELLLKKTRDEYPRFTLKERDKSWLRLPFRILKKVTGNSYRTFTTTIFSTMYVGETWDEKTPDQKYKTLRHERKHIDQFHCWPLGRWAWPLNHLLMALCYMLVLPVILTFRAKFEREGYTETLLVLHELNGDFADQEMERLATWLAKTFGTSTYLWMWRKKAAYAWAMDTMRKINAGEIRNPDRIDLPQAQ